MQDDLRQLQSELLAAERAGFPGADSYIAGLLQRASSVLAEAKRDQETVDAIAVRLWTNDDWCGGDELEWIANRLMEVRPYSEDGFEFEYVKDFEEATGRTAPAYAINN